MQEQFFSFTKFIRRFMKRNYLFLLICLPFITQCTIEKRLYNKGYHIEGKRSLTIQNKKSSDHLVAKKIVENSIEQVPLLDCSTDESNNTVERPSPNKSIEEKVIPKDTIYVVEDSTHKGWSSEKKKRTLLGVGVATMATGLVAGALLSEATAAGASLSSIIFLGVIGWTLAVVAAILLLLFLVFLCIPANNRVKNNPKSGLSDGESLGLMIMLTLFGIIGVIFLLGNQFS